MHTPIDSRQSRRAEPLVSLPRASRAARIRQLQTRNAPGVWMNSGGRPSGSHPGNSDAHCNALCASSGVTSMRDRPARSGRIGSGAVRIRARVEATHSSAAPSTRNTTYEGRVSDRDIAR